MNEIQKLALQLGLLIKALAEQSASSKKINEFDEVTEFKTGMYVAVFDPTKGDSGGVVKFPFIDKEQDLTPYQLKIQAEEIVASGGVFKWNKKPSNTTNTLAVGEVITNGRISETIHIYSAIYTNALADADIDNFGTEANNFTDGNYKQVQFEPNL